MKDRININVPNGWKEEWENHAKKYGYKSLTEFIIDSVYAKMASDIRIRENARKEIKEKEPDVSELEFELLAAENERLKRSTAQMMASHTVLRARHKEEKEKQK
ncbi:MAG: hypothetical protein IKU47_07190 [Oscillospiraceae bacterium]|nr:hypothetical protein [Oscillospiraceae bacterium]